jgi:hypothetical protein
MEHETNEDIKLSPNEIEEIEETETENSEESTEDDQELRQELQEEYGSPIPEEKHNQWTTINTALRNPDTVRTTFLSESELGRPLFSVRFLLDMQDCAIYSLNNELESMGFEAKSSNLIANYFWEKVQNITSSGMSNKGFTMNLNVTQRKDTTRKRIREVKKEDIKKL